MQHSSVNLLEKEIEKRVCDYAKAKGWLVYKFSSPGHSFVPDRIFINPNGVVVFIEFKRKGQKPTPMQAREIERLQSQHVRALVVDDVDKGKHLVDFITGMVP